MNLLIRRSLSLNTTSKILHLDDIDIDETAFSVFRGEEVSINKILSRDSSFGQSSRIYYTSTNNLGVPFQWEKKPGTPMNPPPREEVIQPTPPPPPPSPAMQSLVLPRPMVERKGFSLSWRFWSWRKRLRRIMRLQMYDRRRYLIKFRSNANGNKVSSSDGNLDAEFVGWIHGDSKSSSSSTISSSVGLSSEHFESFREGVPFCCTTWRKHKSNNK